MKQLIGIGSCREPKKKLLFFFAYLCVAAYGISNLMDVNLMKDSAGMEGGD